MSDSTFVRLTSSTHTQARARRRPVGVEYLGLGLSSVRVWAPAARSVEIVLGPDSAVAGRPESRSVALVPERGGYFSATVEASAGERYQFRLAEHDRLYPDPASRFQPDGPHGSSEIIDPDEFVWTDEDWRGVKPDGHVIYEMHVGTMTRAGTWEAAAWELPELARLGITVIEVMPVAEFSGRFGWGYDGVDPFAPYHGYGRPDDFRGFVNIAHSCGIAVILDVVYNHMGPDGNYLRAFAPAYFTTRYDNEWGDAINFDDQDAGPVRELFVTNAAYWIDEFHLDGLRLDATQQIHDRSPEHIIAALGRRARAAAGHRSILLVAENEPQDTRLIRSLDCGGYGLDALWNDDFHHAAMVALTGNAEAYYTDTTGTPQEFISAAKYGYLFQGQHYHWQRERRGTTAWDVPPAAFVTFLQNHDQVANSAFGLRGHALTSGGRWRAMTSLLLLGPGTPMLFQGQEFSASAPFLYFADFDGDLADAVRRGRVDFLKQFPSMLQIERRGLLAKPGDVETFNRCRLDLSERESHAEAYALHSDLLQLRRDTPALRGPRRGGLDGSVLSSTAFALRFFTPDHADDRLLIVNLGPMIERGSFADPLLAPPDSQDWALTWSTEDPAYGGAGAPEVFPDECWRVPAECALLLAPGPRRHRTPLPKLPRIR